MGRFRWGAILKVRKLGLPLVLVIFGAGACWSLAGTDELADMEINAQAGTVTILRGNETIVVRDEPVPLEVQDIVKTGKGDLAVLNLADSRQIKMQPKAQIIIDTTRSIESERGNVLVDASEQTVVSFDGAEAAASNSRFRVDSGFGSVRVGAYDGRVSLSSPGQAPLTVRSLFQATVAAGDIGSHEPYQLNKKDAWDLDLLEEVVELEGKLDLLAKGFSRQLGRDRPDLNYFRALANQNVSFMSRYLDRKTLDLLIGFTVADNARSSLESAFKKAFHYRDAGASWGITAAIMKVKPQPVVAQLEDVILGTGVVAAGGEAEEAEFSVAAAEASEQGVPLDGTRSEPRSEGSGDQPRGGGDGSGGGGNGADDGDGDGDGDGEQCAEDDQSVECVVGRAISPSPSGSNDDDNNNNDDPPGKSNDKGILDGMSGDGPDLDTADLDQVEVVGSVIG